jgi:hypothetical protein
MARALRQRSARRCAEPCAGSATKARSRSYSTDSPIAQRPRCIRASRRRHAARQPSAATLRGNATPDTRRVAAVLARTRGPAHDHRVRPASSAARHLHERGAPEPHEGRRLLVALSGQLVRKRTRHLRGQRCVLDLRTRQEWHHDNDRAREGSSVGAARTRAMARLDAAARDHRWPRRARRFSHVRLITSRRWVRSRGRSHQPRAFGGATLKPNERLV